MGFFFQKKLVGSPLEITNFLLPVADFIFFNKIIVRRHTTPDTPALLIFMKTLPIGKKFVSSSKNGTIETKNTTISMSVRKGKTMYNE